MRINTNMMALNAQSKLVKNQAGVEKSIQKLSSGLRINSAADDAAGLAISEKMRAQIRGLEQAESNAQDGISLLQTAEGALQQTTDILQRMKELVIKAQNTGVLTAEDRSSINTELTTLREEINRIATSTTFNGKKLLNGNMATQLDPEETSNHSTLLNISDVRRINVEGADAKKTYKISVSNMTEGATTIGRTVTLEMFDSDEAGATAVESQSIDILINNTAGDGSEAEKLEFADLGVTIEFAKAYNVDGLKPNTGDPAYQIKTLETTEPEKARADFKIGANSEEEDTLSFGIGDMSAKGLSYEGKTAFSIDINNSTAADESLEAIDYAMNKVSAQRAKLGAMQNRMEYAISNLSTTSENLTAAESRIRDVDMAAEMVSYTKNGILNQSAMAMLAQANQQPQQILSLLQ